MSMIMNRAPAHEPVSVQEIKAVLSLSGRSDDTLLSCLLLAARMVCEHRIGLLLIDQEWSFFIDQWPKTGTVQTPIAPFRSIDAVRVHDWHGGAVDLNLDAFAFDKEANPSSIRFERGRVPAPRRAFDSIEFAVSVGLAETPGQIPQPIRQAILDLATTWFATREPVAFGNVDIPLPEPVAALLEPFRSTTLH